MKFIVHHDEIGLKKGNFYFFEKKLVSNIKKACKKNSIPLEEIVRKNKRLICEFSNEDEEKIIYTLRKVFGVKYFAPIQEIDKNMGALEKAIEEISKEFLDDGIEEIAFKTKRSDKKFPLKSPEINERLGEIASNLGLKFNYTDPEKTIYIEIVDKIYVYTQRHEAYGGLPVGTGGRVLCLLSGGIDSPIAAWLMMKRGCNVDFLHFHAMPKNSKILEEENKIINQIKKLNEYQFKSKIYTLPYSTYSLNVEGKIFEEYDLVVFKHYMMRFAERLAAKENYKALITGDNFAQVASQTLENISVTSQKISIPIFRPLIGYNKQEIIDLSREIGLYKVSIKNYKDCCSIISRNPSTKTKLKNFDREIEKIPFDEILEKSLEELDEKEIS